ncbi:MAG: ATP synthase F1 subunit delta [Clostridiales bacterium]|nr:ATP synthase F1 subunit delta [Clostridiales bacterium]
MTDISREYSEALFALAAEAGRGQEYADALAMIRGLLVENPDYIELLASPSIPMDERRAAVDAAFTGSETMDDIASFMKLLCERGHVRDIFDIIDDFQALYKSASGVSTAFITSAVELSETEKQSLCEKLEKKLGHRVELQLSVDASLIGGLIVRVDGKIMDGSIKNRLSDIKELIK